MAREAFVDDVHSMKVLYQEYTKRNDIDDVAGVEQDIRDAMHKCSMKEADVQQTIKDLSRQARELEEAATYPHREGFHLQRVAALERQIDSAKRMIDDMDMEARTAEQQCEEIDVRMRAAMASARELAAASSSEAANLMSELSMYKHITGVTWWPGKSTISGTVSDAKTGDIRMFDFDQDIDKVELVNKLWELL
ncbi:hypothetical protein VOLCADRAFT_107959 [Volvox carteri f. nagariensis]|uniref:Kinetochore protein Spc24 n=1 Tax=Volvox carteri f. nagariensis TaxID=3068 RepID=D8UHG0_VOLCA|nr:uncharacterized protein VOLCADRAFT_107959 [Volvox carteri f. nagariensis]EFJ40818.1 hypothetical protein VOLCADRAFT_107959 [Volvox carteri f. nagariensis]|eukprot:XP_002958087.1 hypothetical protein VOLCADRAFT_107959 [Volvox carteri f. nagariensis]